jgi:DNA helicase-2/ATP-dependent DNA helicase PcrA
MEVTDLDERNQSAYLEEATVLKRTAAEIRSQRERLEAVPRYFGDNFTEQVLESARETGRQNLTRAAEEPYFGRLDFQDKDRSKPMPLYIGKTGLEEEGTGRLLVIDWRAPVAGLFYSFTGGEDSASYESPDGTVTGTVHLKRNIVIRKRTLQRVVDSYVKGESGNNPAVTDEFLLFRLGENKDNRLRDIVSTIQAEQDRIIRAERNSALFIQGVAGSGKTTVALHRLAYLLYQYRESIRAENMIIFAPNRMFLDYISGVLPELGVGRIRQTIFADWALDRLEDNIKVSDPAAEYERWFAVGLPQTENPNLLPGRFKGSAAFVSLLDDALHRFEARFIPEEDFRPWEGAVLKAETIRKWFYEEYGHYPLVKRIAREEGRIKRWLEMELDKIRDEKVRKETRKKASAKLRAYLKTWPVTAPLAWYARLFDLTRLPSWLPNGWADKIPADVAAAATKTLKRRTVAAEDLAPLVYIHDRFHGIETEAVYDHVVIDEAQDFSPLQLALLKRHVRGGSFTVLGDLSQGIHDYKGIADWDEFLDLFEPERRGFYKLRRSYRSTMEIIGFANEVLRRGGLTEDLAVPVFRSGDPVKIEQVGSKTQQAAAVCRTVRGIREQGGVDTVAVITRTMKTAEELHTALRDAGLESALIHAGQERYGGGLSVLPAYLAKGLEFDAVVLADADADHYGPTAREAKLLYVACTRALHKLAVLHTGQPSPLLPDGRNTN